MLPKLKLSVGLSLSWDKPRFQDWARASGWGSWFATQEWNVTHINWQARVGKARPAHRSVSRGHSGCLINMCWKENEKSASWGTSPVFPCVHPPEVWGGCTASHGPLPEWLPASRWSPVTPDIPASRGSDFQDKALQLPSGFLP